MKNLGTVLMWAFAILGIVQVIVKASKVITDMTETKKDDEIQAKADEVITTMMSFKSKVLGFFGLATTSEGNNV